MVAVTDLPTDILYNIFPYLNAAEFLSLTSTTKILQTYRQDPNFWRSLTRTTFRIPPQPLLQADGARWQWLYRRLRTQTRLYTWGSNGCGNLGHGFSNINSHHDDVDDLDMNNRNIGWPKYVTLQDMPEDIGIIADVQCGGWCTTLLNSNGCLYICGGIDEASAFMTRSVRRRLHRSGVTMARMARQLTFPVAYPSTTRCVYEPSTAIAQFSTGRKHILGLADDGKVWQWNEEEARLIKPLHVDVSGKRVTRVTAGWDRASIYVNGVGIVYWPDHIAFRSQHATEEDAILLDTATVPGTSYLHSSSAGREDSAVLSSWIGQVMHHVMLENYVVFTTSLNKIFLYRMDFPLPDLDPPEPVEITTFYTHDIPFEVRDLQGSFRSFALFTTAGAVLMGDRAMLDAFYTANQTTKLGTDSTSSPLPQPRIIAALQNNSVTSIAFGDHHFQALRSDGTILAYGTDNQSCGALGLGFPNGTGPLRGVLATGFSNGGLGNDVGRQVWFDPTMHRWLADMKEKGQQEDESKARAGLVLGSPDYGVRRAEAVTAMGAYFEREGRKWEDGVKQKGEMGSYFVLKVAAAGWHSAALVLVDEDKAERARLTHVLPPKAEVPEEDWHEGTWEDIDAPWDQLSNALRWCANWIWTWIWTLGRMFLGLEARDKRVEAERKKDTTTEGERENGEGEEGSRDAVRYRWTDQPFPRLRMANGEVMPGEIEIMG